MFLLATLVLSSPAPQDPAPAPPPTDERGPRVVEVGGDLRWAGEFVVAVDRDDPDPRGTRLAVRGGSLLNLEPTRVSLPPGASPPDPALLRVRPTLLDVRAGAELVLEPRAHLRVQSGCSLWIEDGATLHLKEQAGLRLEPGAYLCIEPGARVVLESESSVVTVRSGALRGLHPDLYLRAREAQELCALEFAGEGRVVCGDPTPTAAGEPRAWFALELEGSASTVELDRVSAAGGAEPLYGRADGCETVPGPRGWALEFVGSGSAFEIADDDRLDVGDGDFSLALWMRSTQSGDVSVLVDKRSGSGFSGTVGYHFFTYRGDLCAQLASGQGSSDHSNYNSKHFVADGEWHHVVLSVDRDQPEGLRFYVDGQPTERGYSPLGQVGDLDNTGALFLGRRTQSASGGYRGAIDDFRLYPHALQPAEVLGLYEQSSDSEEEEEDEDR